MTEKKLPINDNPAEAKSPDELQKKQEPKEADEKASGKEGTVFFGSGIVNDGIVTDKKTGKTKPRVIAQFNKSHYFITSNKEIIKILKERGYAHRSEKGFTAKDLKVLEMREIRKPEGDDESYDVEAKLPVKELEE